MGVTTQKTFCLVPYSIICCTDGTARRPSELASVPRLNDRVEALLQAYWAKAM